MKKQKSIIKIIIKWIVVFIGFIQVPVMLLPYVKGYSAFEIMYESLTKTSVFWKWEFVLEYALPVGLSLLGALFFLIRANIITDIFAIIFNGIAVFIYKATINFYGEHNIIPKIGFKINRGLVVAELVLLIIFAIVTIVLQIISETKKGNQPNQTPPNMQQ